MPKPRTDTVTSHVNHGEAVMCYVVRTWMCGLCKVTGDLTYTKKADAIAREFNDHVRLAHWDINDADDLEVDLAADLPDQVATG